MSRERDRLDLIFEAVGALLREVGTVAESQADILTKLDKLDASIGNLEASQDMTAIGNRLDQATARIEALVPASTSAAPPADGSPQIDPNTGQPVQPV